MQTFLSYHSFCYMCKYNAHFCCFCVLLCCCFLLLLLFLLRINFPGTCVSFSHEDKDLFLVGSENGGLYKCSLRSTCENATREEDLLSPIKFVFRPHHGPVYDINTSPFHRNLFLSCGTDSTVRVYSLLDVSDYIQWARLLRYK